MVSMQKENALSSLTSLFGTGQVVTNAFQLRTYEMDAGLDRGKPLGVVFPKTTEDIIRLVQWANENNISLIARGAGTGLSGGAVAEHGGVIAAFAGMNRVIEFDEVGRSAVVEPGVVNSVLDELAKAKGLYYPPDPSSGRAATMGGNIAENAGGPHCFKYGVTTNYVTGLQVVLADGSLVQLGGRALDYPEYDFLGVMTGNEGTLGIITQASVRLIRNAPAVQTLLVAFDAIEQAGRAVSAIIAHGLVPATLEFMDQRIMRILEDYTHAGLPVDAEAALIIEVDGFAESLSGQMDEIIADLCRHHARDLRLAQTSEERDQIWYARKSVGGAIARIAPAYYPVDGTVPRSKIAETLKAITEICAALKLSVSFVLHAGDGNVHPHIFIDDPHDHALVERVLEAGRQVMVLCVNEGGSITGEHGVGTEKRSGMSLMYNADELRAMLDVKGVFDPKHLLNPGKIFPAELPTSVVPPAPRGQPASPYAPASAQEVASALQAWCAADPPKTVRIRGNGIESAALPPTDVLLSTLELRGIGAYAPEDLYVTVGAGIRLLDLQRVLAKDRMWLPLVSPWQESTVGGIVATNSNAPLRMRYGYGGVRDLVLAVTVVQPNGRIIRCGRSVVKNVAGYDLTKLFVGSHGTLGVISDITFQVVPMPRARSSLIASLDSLERAISLAPRLLRVCLVASAVLLCHRYDPLDGLAPYTLIYTAEGLKEDAAAEIAEVRGVLAAEGVAVRAECESSGSEIWATWLGAALPAGIVMRVGFAPKDLPGMLGGLAQAIDNASFIADLGNGQLYLRDAKNVQAVQKAVQASGGYAVVLSASPGSYNGPERWGHTPGALDLMRALKARWDPGNLLNPGAFIV